MPISAAALWLRPRTGYQIARSLRFNDDDSAYLNRTPGAAGNRKTWTWSGLVKRGNLGSAQYLWSAGSAASDYAAIYFDSSDKLNVIRVVASATDAQKVTTQVFRDPGAWYHILVLMDAANTTLTVYVNGSAVTALDTNDNPSNVNGEENNTVLHEIGRRSYTPSGTYFDGYMAEIHFVDGTALTPSTFGETSATTGQWVPKKVTGVTYGTNGFWLSFYDNASTTTLGNDDAGGVAGGAAGSNDWTLTNFSVTAGVGNDSLTDTPTDNYSVFNKLSTATTGTLSNGGLDCGASGIAISSVGMSAEAAYYWEITSTGGTTTCGMYNTAATSTTTVTTGTTKGFRFDGVNGTFDWTSDGSAWTSIATGLTSGPYFIYVSTAAATTASLNTGQRSFAYAQPGGYRKPSSANLPTPSILKPSQYFNAVIYTGTGSSLAVTGAGHQPDLAWLKGRSGATDHAIYDAVRGAQARLETNNTDDEATTDAGLTAFGSDGFTVNTLAQVNTNTATYVGWTWKESVTAGLDIVSYTGNGSNRTINHDLGAVPHFMIVKARTTAGTNTNWAVYHRSLANTEYLLLNSTAALATGATYWNSTTPTSSVFSVGTHADVNTNSDTYIAYLWTEIAGFSKFGSYTGNNSTDGPFVHCGFRPKFVLVKCTSAVSTGWVLWDTARGTYNQMANPLSPSAATAEPWSAVLFFDLLSNGFKIRNATYSETNGSGASYIFAAFSELPGKYTNAR